ncbi:MAG: endoribonuclease protein [Variovorax sp.]|nr:endoribonuclease protein [Variovorax sp.]
MSLADSLDLAATGDAPFGALGYGTPAHLHWMPTVDAQVLSARGAMADVWHAGERIDSGATGSARWRSDGNWLLGAIDLSETTDKAADEGLSDLSHHAYSDLFKALDEAGTPHLLRIWNYLPRINGFNDSDDSAAGNNTGDTGGSGGTGLERYRQFNFGRQQAFIDADRPAFDGAPAACALGIRQGALSIRFLAGRKAPVPVENPRQVSAYRYPPTYGPRAPTFSRAALAEMGGGDVALFISGTASIIGHETVHGGDVREQTRETLRNLAAVVDAANKAAGDLEAPYDAARFTVPALDCVIYVRHIADVAAIREIIDEVLGAGSHFATHAVVLEADICRSDLLVEIEAHAVASGPRDGS